MSELNVDPEEGDRPRGAGWRQLQRTYQARFRANFTPVRRALHRNEFVAATVELFFSALVGVGKVALHEDGKPPEASGDPNDPSPLP